MDKEDWFFEYEGTPTETDVTAEIPTRDVAEPVEPEASPVEEIDEETPAETTEEAKPETAEQTENPRKGWVPLDVMLDERTKRQEREKELEALREQLAAKPIAPQVPLERPDPFDDLEGYTAYILAEQERIADQKLMHVRFELSEQKALEKHSADVVKAAQDWAIAKAQADPAFAQLARTQVDPVGWAIQQHKTQADYDAYLADPDGFLARAAAERGYIKPDAFAPQQAVQATKNITEAAKVKAPKSLASVASASRTTPYNSAEDFADIFKK